MTRLPKGPRGAIRQTIALARRPYAHLLRCAERYGDPFTIPCLGGQVVMTGDPGFIRAIFTADPAYFSAPGAGRAQPLVGPSSILVHTGAGHRAGRRLLGPPLHRERMRSFGALIRDATVREIQRWRMGARFSMHRAVETIIAEVMAGAVLGARGPGEVAAVSRAVAAIVASARSPQVLAFAPGWHGGGLAAPGRLARANKEAQALIGDQLRRCRAASRPGDDILSALLAARRDCGTAPSNEDIAAHLVTLLVSGYDATAAMIAWAFHLIHHHPGVLDRLRHEVGALGDAPDGDELARLPLLEAVCHETLRMYPAPSCVIRTLARPLTIRGYRLPAGTGLGAATIVAHYRADTFSNPHRFEPERFLERSYSLSHFFPFGGGARRCIGAAFALYQMKLVLATVVQRARLRLLASQATRPRLRGAIAVPSNGVPMALVAG